MEQEEEELATPTPALPVLPRLDRLDRLLELLEEKHYNLSGRHLCDGLAPKVEQEEDPRKSLSSALEEVHRKGTLLERLTMLENRVLQLSSEMDEANTTRTSSSTNNPASENNYGHDSISSTVTVQQEEDKIVIAHQEKEGPVEIDQDEASVDAAAAENTGEDINKKSWKRKRTNKKWFGWFRIMGC